MFLYLSDRFMNKGKTVFLTGSTGILGANIAAELSKRGYHIICPSRNKNKAKILEDIPCEMIHYSPQESHLLLPHIERSHYIIHAAALTGQSAKPMSEFLDINLRFTKYLVDMAEQANIERFLYISTANCFTNGTKKHAGDETGSFMPWLKKSGYAWSKYLAQHYVLEKAQSENFPGIVLAPTFIIGKRDNGKSSGQLVKHGRKAIVFHPSGGKSFIQAELAAEAIVNSLEKGKIGDAYLLAGENLTYREFYQRMALFDGKKRIFIQVPNWMLAAIANLLEFTNKTFHTQFALDKTNRRLLCLGNYFDHSKARSELDLQKTIVENCL